MNQSGEKDYVLGTHDAEIERLGLQHQVWRPSVFDFWQRARIGRGATVIDAGAGPGFATFDLADIVGREGRVISIERSQRFLSTLKGEAAHRGLTQVEPIEGDLLEIEWPKAAADFIWCRWVLAFVEDPLKVLKRMAGALKPGGALLLLEYSDYGGWRMAPDLAELDRFRDLVVKTWRASGGEPEIAMEMPRLLPQAGLALEDARAVQFAIRPSDFMWQWPLAFVETNTRHQAELGELSAQEAEAIRKAFAARSADPTALMLTPSVLQIVARKPR